jgi:hypothetical protein
MSDDSWARTIWAASKGIVRLTAPRYKRKVPLDDAGHAMRQMQQGLEMGWAPEVADSVKEAIVAYNADDCFSTLSLRNWLERERLQQENAGHYLPRPVAPDGAPAETVSERQQQSAVLADALLRNIPAEPENRNTEEAAR